MKHLCIFILLLSASILTVSSADINGSVEYIGDIRVLNLWGTWSEMGYAHGYLMGPDLKEVFHDYFLEMAGGTTNYSYARAFFLAYFDIPDDFVDYTQGIMLGAADTVSIYSDKLGRDLDYIDICVVSATPDICALKGFLCSSASAWNDATAGEPELTGSPAISRNLDYYVDQGGTILDHSILVTFDPQEGQDWISIGFPGFAGTLSGMNESGISACLNMGNNQGTSQYTEPFVPICMAQATGLYEEDFNGSGTCDVEDVKDALIEWNRANSYDIHIVGDRSLAGQDSASVVVEVSNKNGYAFRYSSDEPDIAPCRMILTNHHRVLIPPVTCSRYRDLMDSLTTNPDVTLDRLWNFMGAVGWPASPGSGGTLQTMILMPEQLKIGLAFSSVSSPSYEQNPEWILWEDIFPNHSSQDIETSPEIGTVSVTVLPNPSSGFVTIQSPADPEGISIFDLSGRQVETEIMQMGSGFYTADLSHLPEGIYRISVVLQGTQHSREVVILH